MLESNSTRCQESNFVVVFVNPANPKAKIPIPRRKSFHVGSIVPVTGGVALGVADTGEADAEAIVEGSGLFFGDGLADGEIVAEGVAACKTDEPLLRTVKENGIVIGSSWGVNETTVA